MILVLLSSMVPYILPHAWLGEHYPGYDFYMFKGMAWTLKLALLIYLYGIVCIFTKNYFPKLSSLCTEEVRGDYRLQEQLEPRQAAVSCFYL